MMVRYARFVVGPALLWALGVGSAFSGIGGMSIMGAGASDEEITRMWYATGWLTAIALLIALAILTWRVRRQGATA